MNKFSVRRYHAAERHVCAMSDSGKVDTSSLKRFSGCSPGCAKVARRATGTHYVHVHTCVSTGGGSEEIAAGNIQARQESK